MKKNFYQIFIYINENLLYLIKLKFFKKYNMGLRGILVFKIIIINNYKYNEKIYVNYIVYQFSDIWIIIIYLMKYCGMK